MAAASGSRGDAPADDNERLNMGSREGSSGQADVSHLRQIPAVDELLGREALRALEQRVGRRLVVDATRKVLQSLRGTNCRRRNR